MPPCWDAPDGEHSEGERKWEGETLLVNNTILPSCDPHEAFFVCNRDKGRVWQQVIIGTKRWALARKEVEREAFLRWGLTLYFLEVLSLGIGINGE